MASKVAETDSGCEIPAPGTERGKTGTISSHLRPLRAGKGRERREPHAMAYEQISPELALVDPALAARARAALPTPTLDEIPALRTAPLAARPGSAPTAAHPATEARHHYPMWARITASLWLLVLGILIGGAAIPHAQDNPRIVPPGEDVPATICKRPVPTSTPAPAHIPRPPQFSGP